MNFLRILSRLLVGIVFIFSGFVKAIDPLGSTYKFVDYFNAFGIGFLESLALPLAILWNSIELVIGITLLLGYRMKVFSWVLLFFMSFFTVLTFILAMTNPVHDCGCFGDALILTNWETFWKNVVIMIFTTVIFLSRNAYQSIRSQLREWMVIIGFFLISVTISVYSYNNLPVLDFRPYSMGTYIPDKMIIPEDAEQSEFETLLYYRNRKNGMEKEFTMDNFPKDTASWEFIDAVTTQISGGYEPPIHDFNIFAPDETEITAEILNESDYTFLLISYDAIEADKKGLAEANSFYRLARARGDINFYAVSSSLRENLDSIRSEIGLEYDFCQADEITLKTIIRSNPGLVLIKNGTITGKWHFNNYPDINDLGSLSDAIRHYPFCSGCDLREFITPPSGSGGELYETILYYKNQETGDIREFNINDFPKNSEKWTFQNSVSNKISSGFKDPVSDLKITSAEGYDMNETALFNNFYTMLIFLKDPEYLNEQQFQSMIKFGGMASEYLEDPVDLYPVTGMDKDEIIRFTTENITPFDFYSGDPNQISDLAGDFLRVVLLRNGRVLKNWFGPDLPDPSVLSGLDPEVLPSSETILEPMVISELKQNNEKAIVYIFILCFLFIILVLRLYFNMRVSDA